MKKYYFVLAILMIAGSCKKDVPQEPEPTPVVTTSPTPANFSAVIQSGGNFPQPINTQNITTTIDSIIDNDTLWACVTENYDIVQGLQEFPLFNPNSSVIYPGNLLQGGTLLNATPDVIVVDRAGGVFSIDIVSGSWDVTASVTAVVKSQVIQALNDIVNNSSYSEVPANISFSLSEVHSEKQLALELGLDFSAYGVAIGSKLSFSNNSAHNRVLVKLTQSYYTMSFDLPANYNDLFASTVTPADLDQYIGPGNPACYISDVTYGRVFYLLVESTSEASSITSSINASFSGVPNTPSANINTSYLSSLDELNIKLFALGGNAQTTLLTVGSGDVNSLASTLSDAGDITTGAPLSYVCRAVHDNQIVSINLTTQYDITSCVPIEAVTASYGILPSPMLYLKADDANTSNDGILSYNNNSGPEGTYSVGSTYGIDIGGQVVENWPDDGGVHIANTSDPNNRPVFISNALNGYAAIEFCYFNADGTGSGPYYDQEITTELDIPGALFVNTDYTLFMVVASPTKLNVVGSNITSFPSTGEPIDAGSLMQGSDSSDLNSLTVGFNSNNTLLYGHNSNDLNIALSPNEEFRLVTLRFSKTEGMTAWINDYATALADDNSLTNPLLSNTGLKLNAKSLLDPNASCRSQIVEIRAYDVAVTDSDRQQVISAIMTKYGL